MAQGAQDITLVVADLVATLSKHASQQDMLAKRRIEIRYRVEMPLPVRVGLIHRSDRFVAEFKVWATNISNTGLGLLTDRELTRGTELTIGLAPFGLFDNVIPGKVVFSRNLIGNVHRVGVVFILDNAEDKPGRK